MRKLMWFTMGYAMACGLGTWLLRGRGLLLLGLGFAALAIAAWFFREHPVCKRAGMLALGCAVGCLSFFTYALWVLGPAAAMDGQTAQVAIRTTG